MNRRHKTQHLAAPFQEWSHWLAPQTNSAFH